MSTNGTPTRLALALADAQDGYWMNRMVSVAIQKVGATRGPKGNKTRFGDDKVLSILLPTSYMNVQQRSMDKLIEELRVNPDLFLDLAAKADAKGIKGWDGRGKNATEVAITAADFKAAYDALIASLMKTLSGVNQSTRAHVYEPLVVDGENVPCAKVYIGGGNPDDKRTPEVGSIYVSGMQLAQHVLEDAPNGPVPSSKSGPQVVAKRLISAWLNLPNRRWRTYRLQANEAWRIKTGADAATVCDSHKVTVSSDDVRDILDVAA